MGNVDDIRLILGSLRYKSAPDVDFSLKTPLIQTTKEIIEFDRSLDIGLEQVYNDERQNSTTFRPTAKFQLIFENTIGGTTNYPPFENNLYYFNAAYAARAQCVSGTTVQWSGLPQYNEFDFIRTDYNVSGYTQPSGDTNFCHIYFEPQSASTYNWNFFISYPYSGSGEQIMNVIFPDKPSTPYQWTASTGIPFIIKNITINGDKLIAFKCPMKHGLSVGEFVKLNFSYNFESIFRVYSLGLHEYGNEEYVFNISNIGYTGNTFNDFVTGTFRRIVNIENVNDTLSQYYVRQHKLLTNVNDAVLVKAGFENNIFGTKKKFESSGFTPNYLQRVSIKEGAQSYTISFNTDIDTFFLLDNQKRPVTELFFTTIWKGYFGWTFGVSNPLGGYYGLQKGWEFNLPLNPLSGTTPSPWWDKSNSNSYTNFKVGSYTTAPNQNQPMNGFTYIESLSEGDVLDGDFCEWNNYEQKERVISQLYHKFKFNPYVFDTGDKFPTNRLGYYYQPHHSLTLRVFSDYVETGDPRNVVDIPNYSYYSTSINQFIWRDIYDYGFIDNKNRGVTYPFFNGVHYPYGNYTFRLIPEGSNYNSSLEQNIIYTPLIDYCE